MDVLPQGSEHQPRLRMGVADDFAIYMLDAEGYVATWNSDAERYKGYRAEEIVGSHYRSFFLDADREQGAPEKILSEARQRGSFRGEGWRRRKDGSTFWASVVLNSMHNTSGDLIGFTKITSDQTSWKLQQTSSAFESSLVAERNRLHTTLHSIGDGVICTDSDGCITLMNAAAETIAGWKHEEAAGKPVEEVLHFVHVDHGTVLENPVRACLAGERSTRQDSSVVLAARDGKRREIQASATLMKSDEETVGSVLVLHDVTRLRTAQRELAFQANHDALTSLPNRRYFEQELARVVERTRVLATECVVCFLDLDRFKIINDTAGHPAGDALLRIIGNMLTQHLRSVDLVARLGGDEFGIILNGCSLEQSAVLLEGIIKAIEALTFRWEQRIFRISASIGVASVGEDSTPTSVMKQADVACYAAKHAGRNRMSVFLPDHGEVHERQQQLTMAADVRDALRENRFTLYAQKIIALAEGSGEHYEILLRMLDPAGQIISPAAFIPAAERYDLMAEVDRWVIRRALLHFGPRLLELPELNLSINLSANSLNDPGLLPFLMEVTTESRFPLQHLMFEITESALINNLGDATKLIEQLRGLGCRIALDDFGIGLCSFNYLRSFAVDYIKIDGSFVRNMSHNAVDHAIVSAISGIAQQVEAKTIAEFVEDDTVLLALRALHIDLAQGYAIGRPEPFEQIVDKMEAARRTCELV